MKRRFFKLFIQLRLWQICCGLFLFCGSSFFPLPSEAKEIREFYNTIRNLSMGGTSVVTTNDETALAVNPAGLGKLRDMYGTTIDPEIEVSKNYDVAYRQKAFTEPLDLPSVSASLLENPDLYYHARAQLFPSFVAKNFGIGILARRTLDAKVNTALTEMETFYRDDLAVVLGYNFRLWGGRLKFGFNGKLISRIEIDEAALDPNGDLTLSNLADTGVAKEGVGIGFDTGLILTAPWRYLPSVGAVVRDVGGTSFDKSYNNRLQTQTRPNTVTQDMDVGVSISPILNNRTRSVFSLEYRNVLTAKDVDDPQKLYHAGAEVNFSDIFFVRAGYHQRYWTAGLELASERFQFQMGSYGEEVGTAALPKEDRRYVLKFAFRF
jgi:hypothetical protein